MSHLEKNLPDTQGFALVAVLIAIAVLSLIAANMLSSTRVSAELARNAEQRSRDRAILDAGIDRAILALLDQRADHRWRVDGVPIVMTLLGTKVTLSIQDELGKIDLNAADKPLLTGLFASVGLDPQATDSIVDKILDWRGGSELKRLNGASDEDYIAANYSYHPRHGPFQRVDELLLVMDMSPDLYRRVEPALTVYSGRPSIDPQVAPAEALRALSQIDQSQTDAMIAARAAETASASTPATFSLPGITDPSVPTAGRAFSVRAEVSEIDGVSIRGEAVIRLTGDPRRPYWRLMWREE